jgi:flagella basal body P-ring formation protein FlgA
MIITLSLFLAMSAPAPGCVAINGDAILARDVATVIPGFAQVPGDFNLGYAPVSGTPRVLRGADLERIAKNRGLDLAGLPDVCFERPSFIPTAEQIRDAMRVGLGVPDARIEVTTWSRHAAPVGELIFPREGLEFSEMQTEYLWHGYVRYGDDHIFAVWAKARITASVPRVVALSNLPAGKPVAANQVRLENRDAFPLDETAARSLDEVVGFLPKSSLRRAAPIRATELERPPDVARGDVVRVQVFAGAAHLVLEGSALSSGAKGTTILVRNSATGKDFRAQVTGKGQVAVLPLPIVGVQVQ